MSTIHIKGPAARNWFAEKLVQDFGAEQALEKTCGPMHEAVKRVIADMEAQPTEQPK